MQLYFPHWLITFITDSLGSAKTWPHTTSTELLRLGWSLCSLLPSSFPFFPGTISFDHFLLHCTPGKKLKGVPNKKGTICLMALVADENCFPFPAHLCVSHPVSTSFDPDEDQCQRDSFISNSQEYLTPRSHWSDPVGIRPRRPPELAHTYSSTLHCVPLGTVQTWDRPPSG